MLNQASCWKSKHLCWNYKTSCQINLMTCFFVLFLPNLVVKTETNRKIHTYQLLLVSAVLLKQSCQELSIQMWTKVHPMSKMCLSAGSSETSSATHTEVVFKDTENSSPKKEAVGQEGYGDHWKQCPCQGKCKNEQQKGNGKHCRALCGRGAGAERVLLKGHHENWLQRVFLSRSLVLSIQTICWFLFYYSIVFQVFPFVEFLLLLLIPLW